MDGPIEQRQVGQRMQAAAEAKGLQAYDVATAVGVRAPTIYRWYKGETRPSNEFMGKFAQLVGRSAAYLWTGQESLEEVLLRWARLAETVGGNEALERVRRAGSVPDVEAAELLNRAAPDMLALLTEMGGADWQQQPEAAQRALMGRLLVRLREWKPRSSA